MVQAFQYNIEVMSRDDLIEMLNARCKQVEAAAEARKLRLVKANSEIISL